MALRSMHFSLAQEDTRMNSSQTFSPQTDSWVQLSEHCTPSVLRAPKTWGDPFRSPQMEMPQNLQGIVSYVQNNLVGRPWCDHLVLLAAVLYSLNIQYRTIYDALSALHCGLTDLFTELTLQSMTDWEVDKHLSLYLSGQVLTAHTAGQRVTFWKRYLAGSRHLKRWLASLPMEQQTLYRPFVLPYPDDPHELTQLSGGRQVEYEQQEKRKAETDAIMPFFADLRTQAHLRYNLLVRLRKAYHKAIKAVEQGKAVLPFEFEMREGGNVQKKQPATERLVFKLWDRRTFVLEQVKENSQLFSRDTVSDAQNRQRSFSPERNSYLLEFIRVESLDEGGPVVGLWFLELLERKVLGQGPLSGSRGEGEEKQTWLRAQGYGDEGELVVPFSCHTPGVLLPSKSSGDGDFVKYARERTGALFIPVESFYVAATFGMVALHILTANGMRIGELLQLRASADCIVPIVISPSPDSEDQTPTIHWAVRAVPKGHRAATTYYLDDEHLRFLSLIKLMLCEHYHINSTTRANLPLVALNGKNKHRFPSECYLFQYNHKGLREEDIRVCLRFLMHGLVFQTLDGHRVIILPHLLRHGFATWALNVAKEPIDIVAAILNQKNLTVTKYYGRPNPRLVAERSHGLMAQISSYIDVDDLILRSPQELRELLLKAQQTHGPLARTRGGRCMLNGECPILFACIGCSAKVPDPAQRGEVEEVREVTLIQIQRAKKKGLTLEEIQHQKKLKQCDAELREMDMIEACREDENREPEVNFEIDA
jgi:hypothetical protein